MDSNVFSIWDKVSCLFVFTIICYYYVEKLVNDTGGDQIYKVGGVI